jgi:hypothetical protein
MQRRRRRHILAAIEDHGKRGFQLREQRQALAGLQIRSRGAEVIEEGGDVRRAAGFRSG